MREYLPISENLEITVCENPFPFVRTDRASLNHEKQFPMLRILEILIRENLLPFVRKQAFPLVRISLPIVRKGAFLFVRKSFSFLRPAPGSIFWEKGSQSWEKGRGGCQNSPRVSQAMSHPNPSKRHTMYHI